MKIAFVCAFALSAAVAMADCPVGMTEKTKSGKKVCEYTDSAFSRCPAGEYASGSVNVCDD